MKSEITEQDKLNLKKKFEIVDNKPPGWVGYLKLDPTMFAYNFFVDDRNLPLRLFPHQDLILNDKSQLRLLNLARGAGKSTIAAIEAITMSYWNDNSLVLIMSSTKPQALEVIRKIKVFLNTSRFTTWKELFPKGKKESKAEIEIKNPGKKTYSRIISVPATDAARGYSPNLIICDELAFWENQESIFNQVVLGMLNRIDGIKRRILALSTPNGRFGPFWECFNNKAWSSYQFNWRINPYNTEEMMNILRSTMTDLQFRAEYEAEFVSSRDAYFTQLEINNAISSEANQGWKGEPNCVVGVDFGKINDKCVIDIGAVLNQEERKNKQVIRLLDRQVQPLGSDYALVIAKLKAINEVIKPNMFMLDATGVGEGPSDVLKAEGIPVEPFKFSLFSKVTIMNNLKILMQQGRIQIPNDKELISQIEMFEYEASKSGGVMQPKLHAPIGKHDDEVDALALMCYGLVKDTGYIYSKFITPVLSEEPDEWQKTVDKGVQHNIDFVNWLNKNSMQTF